MKPRTRDNLIYLAVGLSIAALVWIEFFYAESHHTRSWTLSKFTIRTGTTSSLLVYFVVREMRRERATLVQMLAAVLFASVLQLGIMFGFRGTIDQLPGITYSVLAVFEMFLVWQLSVRGVLYLIGSRH